MCEVAIFIFQSIHQILYDLLNVDKYFKDTLMGVFALKVCSTDHNLPIFCEISTMASGWLSLLLALASSHCHSTHYTTAQLCRSKIHLYEGLRGFRLLDLCACHGQIRWGGLSPDIMSPSPFESSSDRKYAALYDLDSSSGRKSRYRLTD